MHRYLFIIITCIFGCNPNIHAEDGIISSRISQDGECYNFNHIFTKDSPITFYLTDNSVKGNWNIALLSDSGTYENVSFYVDSKGNCIFTPSDISWGQAMKQFDESLNRDLFEIEVRFITDSDIQSSEFIHLGLLPSYPVISNEKFTYVYDWEWDDIWPNGNFSFTVESSGAKGFMMYFSDSFLFSPPKFYRFSQYFKGNDSTIINYDADWGEYIRIETYNQYGAVINNPICTTSYITDESVLNRIAELEALADIETISTKTDLPVWDNNILSFNQDMSFVQIYNLAGVCIESVQNISSIDLAHLSKGMYIVVYQNYHNKSNTFKILKQ